MAAAVWLVSGRGRGCPAPAPGSPSPHFWGPVPLDSSSCPRTQKPAAWCIKGCGGELLAER